MLTLQNFITPEREICTEQMLYYRPHGAVGYSQSEKNYLMPRGSRISFGTYFNLFNLGKWNRSCDLKTLFVELLGRGTVEVRLILASPTRSWEVIYSEIVELQEGAPLQIDLSEFAGDGNDGILYVEIVALDSVVTLNSGRFATADVPAAWPRLAVSITTFKRERDLQSTVSRLGEFLKTFEYRDNLHVQVVDNGKSAAIRTSDWVSVYPNSNLGGAGGFARGLLEAERGGFTHCLFMDDDASFHMENLVRTYTFLALAKDPKVAISGAMINNTHKWAMWENSAYFDGSCHPLHNGTDLRDLGQNISMEFGTTRPHAKTLYGGWWFFAFPIAHVQHYPFPFFVRGDDISFSLANKFRIVTISGVVSFQEDFTEKESAQTLYLDLRNHLLHHLVFDQLNRSAIGTAKIAIRFMMRAMLRFKYESAESQLLAWQDVMKGPEFFDDNIDMSERRTLIKSMIKNEVWREVDVVDTQERYRFSRLPRRLRHYFGLLTLNGHLIPFWSIIGDRKVLNISDRGLVLPAFGCTRLTYLNTERDKGYVVTHSKVRFFSLAWRMFTTLVTFHRSYRALQSAYRKGYDEMTTQSYWQRTLADDMATTDDAKETTA